MFGNLFRGNGKDREEGQRLFELGMLAAVQFRSNEAIQLYTQSIAVCPNPSPYINRANLFMKRVRCREALNDLLEAKKLDDKQGRQFSAQINREIAWAKVLASNYENGAREKLIADLRSSDHSAVAAQIVCASFGISKPQWEWNSFDREIIEFHLFNDLDDIAKFDDLSSYPEAEELMGEYDPSFIDHKISRCSDIAVYEAAQAKMHNFLCSYDLDDMIMLRRHMIYRIHSKLLAIDFGAFYNTLDSECTGVIREAQEWASQ